MNQVQTGRLRYFLCYWDSINTNPTIRDWVSGYKIPFECEPTQSSQPENNTFSKKEIMLISLEVNKLLQLGAIEPCEPIQNQFLSSIFLHPKADGTWRFILNLKKLNKFINTTHFKLEDIRTATRLMSPNCFMANIDLKNAYYSLSVEKPCRKYLRFKFQNVIYEFTCLPFGLSTAPYVFTKIMKPVMFYLRSQGLMSVIYLDDILCFGDSYIKCRKNVEITVQLLKNLGFIINEEKSCLQPKQKCKFLGFLLDSTLFSISLPETKIETIYKIIQKKLKSTHCKIIDFAKLLGLLIAACPAVEYGWLYTKILERHKTIALLNNFGNYNATLALNNKVIQDLQWWTSHLHSHCKIKEFNFKLEIFSDSSLTGWGLVCNGLKSHGYWTDQDKLFHINYLELLAAFIGLKTFASDLSNCEILLRIDNTTAIAYVNKMGGTKYPHLNSLARELWQWCENRGIWVYASYISSNENAIADKESRRSHSEIEWELSDIAYRTIVKKLGSPEVDLFASRANAKCQNYVSWYPDPDALSIDAFTLKWDATFFYAFPPFALLSRSLQKIKREGGRGIVVVPWWPSQPWYPLFESMVTSVKVVFAPHHNLLQSPFRDPHPLHKTLTLIAAVLSGKPS